jgi:hypothetical protein
MMTPSLRVIGHPNAKTLIYRTTYDATGCVSTIVEIGTDLALFLEQMGYEKAIAKSLVTAVIKALMGTGRYREVRIRRIAASHPSYA